MGGTLYGLDTHGTGADLLRINHGTGAATLLGAVTLNGTPVTRAEGLTGRGGTLFASFRKGGAAVQLR